MRQLFLLLLVTLFAMRPAVAAIHNNSASCAPAYAHRMFASTAEGTAHQSWKQKLVKRLVQSKVGKFTLKVMSRMAAPAGGATNTLSLVAGILGIVSLATLFFIAWLPLLTGVAALALGIVGLGQINKRNEGGMGWALTGIIGGGVTILVYLLFVVFIASWLF